MGGKNPRLIPYVCCRQFRVRAERGSSVSPGIRRPRAASNLSSVDAAETKTISTRWTRAWQRAVAVNRRAMTESTAGPVGKSVPLSRILTLEKFSRKTGECKRRRLRISRGEAANQLKR